MEPQIVAMGGGGFAREPENLLLEKYVLSLSRNRIKPRVCFLPTASGDAENYVERFYTSFGKLDAVPSHLPLFGLKVRDIRAFLLAQDVIHVGGGNTLNMFLIWRQRSIDAFLRAAVLKGNCLWRVNA